MDAREFFEQYISMVKEWYPFDDKNNYFDIYSTDAPAFTRLINNSVVPEIIKRAGLEYQNEYFRIDTVGWRTKYQIIESESKELGLVPHLWDLKVAVEHENSKSDWLDEVVKLTHIRCPLKVVIAYVHCDERGDTEMRKINLAHKCICLTEAFERYADEEFLIIIGNGAPLKKANGSYDKFGYRGYVLKKGNDSFVELKI